MLPHLQTPVTQLLLALLVLAFLALVFKLTMARWLGARFKLKSPLLSAPEQDLYRRLVASLPDHVVLAQVAFSQMIEVRGGNAKENFRKRGTAKQKVADFVICDKSFEVVAVIELDDSTHDAAKDEKRDEIIREAGSKTIRWYVSRLPRPDEIRRTVLGI
jgi:hypothetical protein